jgi:uncharacterized protein
MSDTLTQPSNAASAAEPAQDIRNTHGAPGWLELRTSQSREAAQFLAAAVGWQITEMTIAGSPYLVGNVQGHDIGGIREPPPDEPATPQWTSYVTVADTAEVVARAQEAGGQVLAGPIDMRDVGRFVVLAHPAVGALTVMQYDRPFA